MRRFVVALTLVSCTDPVRDAEIAALGPEDPAVAVGPEHRPGQPCLHCHTEDGPASGSPFAMAGTVYQTNQPGSPGAENIIVGLIDAAGGAPLLYPVTNKSGNFYVPLADWPRDKLKFPVRAGLYRDSDPTRLRTPPLIVMKSLIGREGSCNFCHRRNYSNLTEDERYESTTSAGQIYLQLGSSGQ